MSVIYNEFVGVAAGRSPIDIINTALLASDDYTIRRTVLDPTDGYLSELWADAINTTSGETFGVIYIYTGASLTVYACSHIDTGLLASEQPGVAPSQYYSTRFTAYAKQNTLGREFVSIDRDFIYCNYVLDVIGTGSPYIDNTCFVGIVEKTATYSGGLVFLVSHKTGESFKNVYYEGTWYGDSVAANANNVMCHINALHVAGHFPASIATSRYFYAKVSIHVNITPFEDNTTLVLLGFLPNGIFGTKRYYRPYDKLYVTIPEGNFIGRASTYCDAIDTLLFKID